MLTLAAIAAARDRIRDHIFLSPCAYTETLSRMTGCRLYLKLENLQMTGSFKERGALNKIALLTAEQRAAGVVAASAGNHAQGVARAAQLAGIRATIVMPETTPLAKQRGTHELGAEIVLYGSGYDEAFTRAQELQQQHGYTFIHAFDDPAVIAGQGSIGLELLEQVPDLEMVVVPVGGGGLIAGIATAVRSVRPEVRVIGVETVRLPAMLASLQAGRVTPLPAAKTLADGISVARVGDYTYPLVREWVETIVTVDEEDIAHTILVLLEREKTLAEGAGAVGFAALCSGRIPQAANKRVVVVLSGGNIDMTLLARIIERGLENDGRLARLRVVVPDKPGSVAEVASIIAGCGANIFDLSQSRPVSDVQLGQAELELMLETRGREHVAEITDKIRQAGFSVM
jgi:threonine dehydratase